MLRNERSGKEQGGEKIKKKKWIEAQREILHTPIPAIDVFIEHEEQMGKRREQKKKQGACLQPSYPGTFSCLL